MADAFRLDCKVVVLTGAAGLIGTQVVLAFVEVGARVCAIDRNAALLAQKLGPEHASLLHCPADVSSRDALLKARKQIEGKWGENYSRQLPLGRLADPGDVAGAMRYLVSDASKYVTGHNLVVDGGRTAW